MPHRSHQRACKRVHSLRISKDVDYQSQQERYRQRPVGRHVYRQSQYEIDEDDGHGDIEQYDFAAYHLCQHKYNEEYYEL
jgi:hypothetical protein